MAKKASKKSLKSHIAKEGVFLFKNSKGYGFRVKQNKYVLATAQGYNSKPSAIKGLLALNRMLNDHYDTVESKYVGIIDLTKK